MKPARLLGLALLLAARLPAQTPPPVSHVVISEQATHYLDSLATDARTHRIENAACLASYAIEDSTITITRFTPAHYAAADSVTIAIDSTATVPICPPGTPLLHSHVAQGGNWPPSSVDRHTAQVRGVWSLLLNVLENGYLIRIY